MPIDFDPSYDTTKLYQEGILVPSRNGWLLSQRTIEMLVEQFPGNDERQAQAA